MRSIQVAAPVACAWLANSTNCHVIRTRTISTRIAAADVGNPSGTRADDAGDEANRDVAALDDRNRNAAGDRKGCDQCRRRRARRRSGCAKKNRSRPSAIVMTAKHNKCAETEDNKRLRQNPCRPIDPRHRLTAPAVPAIRRHDHAQKMPASRKAVPAVSNRYELRQRSAASFRMTRPKLAGALPLVFRPHLGKFGVQRGLQFLVPWALRPPIPRGPASGAFALRRARPVTERRPCSLGLFFSFSRLAAL